MNILGKIKNIFCSKKQKNEEQQVIHKDIEEEKNKKLDNQINDKIKENLFKEIAYNLDIDNNLIKSFYKVESSGKNYSISGRLIIRFERHIFKKLLSSEKRQKVIESKIGMKHKNQNDEYLSLKAAEFIDPQIAYQSISMGSMQIMGFHYKKLNYQSAKKMFLNFSESEINVLRGFEKFVKINPPLLKALKNKNFHKIAYYYNGPKYKKYVDSKGKNYADKIKEEYNKLRSSIV